MAEDRSEPKENDGMDPRVLLAAERTLLAWIRTGLAMMGFGFVVARFGLFLRELAAARGPVPAQHGGLSLWAGTALVLLGVCVNAMAGVQHVQSLKRLQSGQPLHRGRFSLSVVISMVLALLGMAMAMYLILMR
ncbi:MAG: YidH family protein [Bacillota bacterium]